MCEPVCAYGCRVKPEFGPLGEVKGMGSGRYDDDTMVCEWLELRSVGGLTTYEASSLASIAFCWATTAYHMISMDITLHYLGSVVLTSCFHTKAHALLSAGPPQASHRLHQTASSVLCRHTVTPH